MTGMTSDEWLLPSQSHQDVSHGGGTILDSVHSDLSNPPAVPGEVFVAEDVSLFPSEVASAARRTIGIGSVSQSTHQLTTPMTPPTEPIHHETAAKPEESMLRSGVLDPVSPLPPTLHRSKRYLSCGQASMLGVGAFALGSYMTRMLFSNQDTVGLEEINLLYNSCLHNLEAVQIPSSPALLWGYPAEQVAMGGVVGGTALLGSVGLLTWKLWSCNKALKKEALKNSMLMGEVKALEQNSSRSRTSKLEDSTVHSKGKGSHISPR